VTQTQTPSNTPSITPSVTESSTPSAPPPGTRLLEDVASGDASTGAVTRNAPAVAGRRMLSVHDNATGQRLPARLLYPEINDMVGVPVAPAAQVVGGAAHAAAARVVVGGNERTLWVGSASSTCSASPTPSPSITPTSEYATAVTLAPSPGPALPHVTTLRAADLLTCALPAVTPSSSPIVCFNRTNVNLFNNIDYLAPVLEELSALHIRAGQAVAFEFDVSATLCVDVRLAAATLRARYCRCQ